MTRQRELSLLGYAGLIPFFAGAVLQWTPNEILGPRTIAAACDALLAYGAIIVAYMAGMGAGGLIVTDRPASDRLWPGMAATLAAWAAIWPTLAGVDIGMLARHLILIGALLMLLFRDLRAAKAGGLPAWYGPLRIQLTAGACASLALSAAAAAIRIV